MFFFLILFAFGVIFGSFGSVLLLRLEGPFSWERLRSIITGRSQCPSCHHVLTRWQLIPLLGWFIQKGKCRYCHDTLSTLYPVCEIVSGLVFVFWGLWVIDYGLGVTGILLGVIWRLLGLILVRDIYYYELHVKLWLLLCFVVSLWIGYIGERSFVRGACLGLITFVGLYLFARVYMKLRFPDRVGHHNEGLGLGDVMIAPIIGSLLTFSLTNSSSLLIDISIIGIIEFIIVFILGTCILGLLRYGVNRLLFTSVNHTPDWSEGMGPVIPFLPSMIIMYRIIVFFL